MPNELREIARNSVEEEKQNTVVMTRLSSTERLLQDGFFKVVTDEITHDVVRLFIEGKLTVIVNNQVIEEATGIFDPVNKTFNGVFKRIYPIDNALEVVEETIRSTSDLFLLDESNRVVLPERVENMIMEYRHVLPDGRCVEDGVQIGTMLHGRMDGNGTWSQYFYTLRDGSEKHLLSTQKYVGLFHEGVLVSGEITQWLHDANTKVLLAGSFSAVSNGELDSLGQGLQGSDCLHRIETAEKMITTKGVFRNNKIAEGVKHTVYKNNSRDEYIYHNTDDCGGCTVTKYPNDIIFAKLHGAGKDIDSLFFGVLFDTEGVLSEVFAYESVVTPSECTTMPIERRKLRWSLKRQVAEGLFLGMKYVLHKNIPTIEDKQPRIDCFHRIEKALIKCDLAHEAPVFSTLEAAPVADKKTQLSSKKRQSACSNLSTEQQALLREEQVERLTAQFKLLTKRESKDRCSIQDAHHAELGTLVSMKKTAFTAVLNAEKKAIEARKKKLKGRELLNIQKDTRQILAKISASERKAEKKRQKREILLSVSHKSAEVVPHEEDQLLSSSDEQFSPISSSDRSTVTSTESTDTNHSQDSIFIGYPGTFWKGHSGSKTPPPEFREEDAEWMDAFVKNMQGIRP